MLKQINEGRDVHRRILLEKLGHEPGEEGDHGIDQDVVRRFRERSLESAANYATPAEGREDVDDVPRRRLSRATNRYPAVGNRLSEDAVEVDTGGDSLRADLLAKCAGLYADRVACFASGHPFRVFPFSGEHFELAPGAVRPGAGFDLSHP